MKMFHENQVSKSRFQFQKPGFNGCGKAAGSGFKKNPPLGGIFETPASGGFKNSKFQKVMLGSSRGTLACCEGQP